MKNSPDGFIFAHALDFHVNQLFLLYRDFKHFLPMNFNFNDIIQQITEQIALNTGINSPESTRRGG